MTDDTDQAEELLQQSSQQRRHTTEATTDTAADTSTSDRVAAIKQALIDIEEGEAPENINLRDARLKALLVGLKEAGGLDEVAADLAEIVEADAPSDASQSDVARLLIRAGLQKLPEVVDDAMEARKQKTVEQADGY